MEKQRKSLAVNDEFDFNTIKINKFLNIILWLGMLIGPAIVVLVKLGVIREVKTIHCMYILGATFVCAGIHLLVYRRWKDSVITGIVALVEMDVLIVIMVIGRFAIHICYFVVPMVSLMFCSVPMYIGICCFNYVFMGVCTWWASSYLYLADTVYNDRADWFIDRMCSYTIEYIIIMTIGFALCKGISAHLTQLNENRRKLVDRDEKISEQLTILESMSEVYEYINLVDFDARVTKRLSSDEDATAFITEGGEVRSKLNTKLMNYIVGDMQKKFRKFTDLGTLNERVGNNKFIVDEFVHTINGWFRAQYIVIDRNADGSLKRIIYTVRNIDETKQKEERLIRISNTDELTGLFNRRSYETDMLVYKDKKMEDDFVIVSADLNNLKLTNDTHGHAAGDELIVGAADCLMEAVGNLGKVYRMGGDEFMACIHTTENMNDIINRLNEYMSAWRGEYTKGLSMAIGYARFSEHPDYSVDDLEKFADYKMYEHKAMQHAKR